MSRYDPDLGHWGDLASLALLGSAGIDLFVGFAACSDCALLSERRRLSTAAEGHPAAFGPGLRVALPISFSSFFAFGAKASQRGQLSAFR